MDALKNLTFNEGGGSGDLYVGFEAGKSVKLRVFTTNPVVHMDKYGNTRYAFVVWDYEAGKAKILSKGASIARPIAELHSDDDYGADITKQDIKIIPSGDGMERRYNIQVLPKPNNLSSESLDELKKLEEKLDSIVKNGIRAERYNEGERPEAVAANSGDEQFPGDNDYQGDESDEPINLDDIKL